MAKIKMTPEQKSDRATLREMARDEGVKLVHNFQTTIAYRVYGDMVRFSTSVHSPKEPARDYSRKYGEYLALDRALNGIDVPMLADDFTEMCYAMDMYTRARRA